MFRTMRKGWLSLAVLLLAMQTSWAQTPELPSYSRSPAALYSDGSRHAPDSSLEDRNGSVLKADSYLEPRPNNLGWFASADLDFLGPHVNNQLTAPVTAGPRTDQVALPSADLHWTLSPRIELGYRFGQATGELLVSFRFLASTGSTTTPAFDDLGNPGALHSRLSMHVIDLDYASQENSLLPGFDMKWRVGVRIASLFFDSVETSPLLERHVSNRFVGAGPHVVLDLWRPLLNRRVGLFCRVEGASVLGQVEQQFEETVGGFGGVTRQSQIVPSFMLSVQAGAAWTPNDTWRFSAGYSYEQWWDATFAGNSRGDVRIQGIFLRAEWKY